MAYVGDSGDPTGVVRDHLANERTLLAWTRTALATAALGFVIAKVRFAGMGAPVAVSAAEAGLSRIAGAVFVLTGLAMEVVGIWRYLSLRRRLHGPCLRPLGWAMIVLNAGMGAAILLLFVYLLLT